METTNPYPPPVSPHEEVENENLQPPIAGPLSPTLPVDDVAHNHEQFMDSVSASLITSLENVVDHRQPPLGDGDVQEKHENQQQEIAGSSSQVFVQSPIEEVEYQHHQQLLDTISPNLLPENSVDCQIPSSQEDGEDHQEPAVLRSPPPPPPDHESPSSPVELQGNPSPSPKLKHSPKDLSPSPPHDTPEPNTPTPPLGVPLLLHAAATFSQGKPHISPWTHQETANLIQAYQEKWYSLKKGPLKAGQWEEVAITVAARCGYDEPTKTSKQCRHKIEKLRKRYRTERGKPRSKATAWNFFKLMDNLEKGPLPISSSKPMELVEYQKPSTSNGTKRKNDMYDDDGDLVNKRSSNSRARNSNHHVANGGLATKLRFAEGANRIVRGLRTPVIHKRKGVYQEEPQEENNENVYGEEEDVAGQLAAEIKGFAEKFVKMENKKIEMMRDVERYRLEMEIKRTKMIIESQQMLVETVNNAFASSVKAQRLSAS